MSMRVRVCVRALVGKKEERNREIDCRGSTAVLGFHHIAVSDSLKAIGKKQWPLNAVALIGDEVYSVTLSLAKPTFHSRPRWRTENSRGSGRRCRKNLLRTRTRRKIETVLEIGARKVVTIKLYRHFLMMFSSDLMDKIEEACFSKRPFVCDLMQDLDETPAQLILHEFIGFCFDIITTDKTGRKYCCQGKRLSANECRVEL